ncbi:hypothetical protein A3J15_01825 [Candidatus Roizmanbacteria bacterium RIFCSPLOWO2_02_FULL_38_10]|uniref:Cytidylate kinase n=1 Tax=Candidatus Roizmanbacteria bacterium RIFCSPLOWO2_02_FULL_38_10 TaxID=1802074 RepID=A0A1F7JKI3_9BACT|nr:MAG: hypothetical protein A3J15_01825 [Candidatus Roizmanbacteria bacterium RIFCSPLOWO2_02_FULL_38_10]
MNLRFDNITISGGVAVGTTTLLNNLKPYLEPSGFKFRSTGQFIRKYTKENVMPVATLVSDDFDRKIEAEVKKLLAEEKGWAIEGWLAGFVAKEFDNCLRILLICSADAVRIDRVVNRDKVSFHEAKDYLTKRERENFNKWKKIYGEVDFFNESWYHLVIDTLSSGPLETVGKVLDKIGYKV